MDSRLQEWIGWLEATRWAALVVDAEQTLVWISDEFKGFLHESDEERLGVGKHIVAAMASPVWLDTLTADGTLEILNRALPYFLDSVPGGVAAFAEQLDEPFRSAVTQVTPLQQPDLWTGRFEYIPGPGIPAYMVNYLATRLRDESGAVVGSCMVTQLGLRPALLALLARGDERAYERMARLAVPGQRQAAILFADLQQSGEVSRRMPTARYFQLIQTLTATFDSVVAANGGVVGKHAGDGWTAFFLTEDAGSAPGAAEGALRTARAMRDAVAALPAAEQLNQPVTRVNVGLHWGSNLYMGQVLPGGRLDVTALGDAVNECARIQETAREGAILASKVFVELLPAALLVEIGMNEEGLSYDPLGAISGAGEKAKRDAGNLAVCRL